MTVGNDFCLADSGDINSMTFRWKVFTKVNALSVSRYMKIEDDKIIPEIDQGTVTIPNQVNGELVVRKLLNFSLVPEFRKNQKVQ